jgi:MSHA biogenesis protein MshG
MPLFAYKGRTANGALSEGELEAASSDAVAGQLMDRGVTPLSIVEQKKKVDVLEQISRKLDLEKVSIEELLMFTRQMSALIKAGIPVTRAIAGILESINNPLLIRALRDTLDQLESGRALSISFARHPKVFNNLYIAMIQVGENTGQLDQAFSQMAAYIERNRRMSHNISAALRYPTIVISAIFIALGVVNLFVIPKFVSFFEANNL